MEQKIIDRLANDKAIKRIRIYATRTKLGNEQYTLDVSDKNLG